MKAAAAEHVLRALARERLDTLTKEELVPHQATFARLTMRRSRSS